MTSTRRPLEAARSALTAGARVEQVLEVVEEDEELPAAEEAGEVVRRSDRLRDLRTAGARGRRGPRAAPRTRRRAACPTSSAATWSARRVFPVPPGPVSVSSRVPFESSATSSSSSLLPPDERARGDGQVRRVERPERREVAVAELVQALGADQVLQPVLAEVADRRVALEEAAGRLGEDDLPAVGSGGDPRRAVDVDADVALVGHDRLAGVDAHADADRAVLERVPRFGGRRDGVGGARKRDEEGVALGVDLDARVPGERVPQGAPVLGEQIGVARPVLLEEPRRALDVREEKGDGAARELAQPARSSHETRSRRGSLPA